MNHRARFAGVVKVFAEADGRDGMLAVVDGAGAVLQRVVVRAGDAVFVHDGDAVGAGASLVGSADEASDDHHYGDGVGRAGELLYVVPPVHPAQIAQIAGVVRSAIEGGLRVVADDGTEQRFEPSYATPLRRDGQRVEVGDTVLDGERDHRELVRLWDRARMEQHLLAELAEVFANAGRAVDLRSLELVVREMVYDAPDGLRLRGIAELPDRRPLHERLADARDPAALLARAATRPSR